MASEAYDPDCSCCWLGFSHTWDYHEAALGSLRASRQAVRERGVRVGGPGDSKNTGQR